MEDIYWVTLFYTRLAMLVVVALGFVWARMEAGQLLLVEMGLLSFVAVTQCAPAVLLGLYWRRGNRRGAFAGISAGFAMWFYTLIIPALVKEGVLAPAFLADGPFGLGLLRPTALLGLAGLDTLSHGVFWSLFLNVGLFVLVSLLHRAGADERSPGGRLRGRGRGQGRHRRARHPVPAGDRAAHPPLRRRGGGARHPPRAARRQGARRALGAGAAGAAHSLRAPARRVPGGGRRADASSRTASPSPRTRRSSSWPPSTGCRSRSGDGGEVRRGERLLASVVAERGGLHLHRGRRGPPRDHEPGGPAPPGLPRAGLARARVPSTSSTPRTGGGWARPSRAAVEQGAGLERQVTGWTRARAGVSRAPRGALHLRRPRPAHGDGGRAPRPHRAGGDPAPAHPAREARLPRRDGGGRGPRDPQSPGRHQDGHQSAVVGRARRSARSRRRWRAPSSPASARSRASSPACWTTRATPGSSARSTRSCASSTPWWRRRRRRGGREGSPSPTAGVERDAVALGDGQKLRQVFANVLQNALEAFGPRAEGGRVEVDLHAEGDRVVVEVSDTGMGISPGGPGEDLPALLHHQALGHGARHVHREEDRGSPRGRHRRSRARPGAAPASASRFPPPRWPSRSGREATHEAQDPARRGRRRLPAPAAPDAGAGRLRRAARSERGGGARRPQGRGRRHGPHRPAPARDGRRGAGPAHPRRPPRPRGGGDDRLRDHRVGGGGDADGGGGLPREALRGGRAAPRRPAGHRVPGARSRRAGSPCGGTRSASPSGTSWPGAGACRRSSSWCSPWWTSTPPC